jgi:general L-amino acid transport system permease protein
MRALVWQAAALGVVVFGLWFFASTAAANLERLRIATGFGFLQHTAGFGIIQSPIPYSESSSYGRVFFVGLLNTLIVAAAATLIATVLGFLIGIARLSQNWLVAKLAAVYVEVLRNVPLLLQLFFWYFAILRPLPVPRESLALLPGVYLSNRGLVLPQAVPTSATGVFLSALLLALFIAFGLRRWARREQLRTGRVFPAGRVALGLIIALPAMVWLAAGPPVHLVFAGMGRFDFTGGWRLLPEFMALLFGLSTYTAAFIAEIVRAGIQSVSHGQTEAARALGLPSGLTLRLVVIPQALRVIVPPLTSQLLNLTKNSSLAVAIAYPDLVSVFAGTVLNQTGQAIEVIVITMAVYLTLSLATSLAMNIYNARVAIVER